MLNLHTSGNDAGDMQKENMLLQNKFQPINFYTGYFRPFHSIIYYYFQSPTIQQHSITSKTFGKA